MKNLCWLLAVALLGFGGGRIAAGPDQGRGGGRGREAGQPAQEYPKPDAAAVKSTSGLWRVSDDWAMLPAGTTWGVVTSATSDAKGAIYVFRREEPPIFVIQNGKLVQQFGERLFKRPHSLRFDREGYLWAIDDADHVVYKIDVKQNNRIVMTLGRKGVSGEGPDTFNRPTDVAFAPNGDFFVSDGYGNSRVVKFSKEGKFLKTWGTHGTAPGQFDLPHAIALDSTNRVIVADRQNGRVQVFDLDGRFLEMWTNLGAAAGLAMAADDTLYVSDVEAGKITVARNGKVLDVIENLGRPHEITLDPSGALYMGDVRADRARKIWKPAR